MLGRVSREGGGVQLKGALHPEQIAAVASALIVDIDNVLPGEEERERWKEVFRELAAKASLPTATFEMFMAWKASVLIDARGYYVPTKSRSKSYFRRMAAWWQRLGLLPKGNTERFRRMAVQVMNKRGARERARKRTDPLAQPVKERSWSPLDRKVRKEAVQAMKAGGLDVEAMGIFIRKTAWKSYLAVQRTKTGRVKKNEWPEVFIPRSWNRRVGKRGWGVIDGRFIIDWIETPTGKQAAFLVQVDRPRDWHIGVGRLDESGPAAQFCGRATYFKGDFILEKGE